MVKCLFIRTSPVLVFHTHTHTCLLTECLHTHCLLTTHCMLAYSLHACNSLLAYLHLHTSTCILWHLHCILCTSLLSLFHLHRATYSVHVVLQVWWKCQCLSVSVEVSVFKGFSGRTLRNAFGKKACGPRSVALVNPTNAERNTESGICPLPPVPS